MGTTCVFCPFNTLSRSYVQLFIYLQNFIGNKEEKDRSKQEKKAEEKAAKQEKKREKNEAKLHKKNPKDVEPPASISNNDSLNTLTYNKVYDDDFDPNEEHINDRELSSGIQMMSLRTSEAIGNIS